MSEATLILPPPVIKAIVDKTAAFIAKSNNAAMLEEKFKQREKTDSRFAFMNDSDPYHAYYADRLAAFKAGEQLEQKPDEKEGADGKSEDDGRPPQPPALEFLVEDPPKINAVDLDILRLTALFTARSGRKFTSDLAARESRNYQFDFLRPSHSLFGYFNRLVEQYTKILVPSKEMLERIERRAGYAGGDPLSDAAAKGRREVLADAQQRVEWEKWESSRRKEEEDKAEAERIAFAEIDWQDFQVASTIEFTENDEAGIAELPPPMSLAEVENMSIAQKKMASMIMEGNGAAGNENGSDEGEMDMEDEDEDADAAGQPIVEQRQEDVVEIQTADSSAPVKIRKDYVRTKKAKPTQAFTTFEGQQIPVDEFGKHIRYEMLDPRWKEEKKQADLNRAASAVMPGGTDVSASMRAIAAHRPDIFGENIGEAEKKRQAEELAKSRAREKNVWDGHAASKETTTMRYQQTANYDDQIAALHRAKGLLPTEESNIGPTMPEPSELPEPEVAAPPAPVPTSTTLSTGACISAAPQPPQVTLERTTSSSFTSAGPPPGFVPQDAGSNASPVPAPPLPPGLPQRPLVPGPGEALPGNSAAGLAPPVPASAPTAAGDAQPASGVSPNGTRPAPDEAEDEPSAKRARRDEGHIVPEEEWLAKHPDPVKITIQLPDYPAKPAWGCKGQAVELELPLTLLIGTVRDRIAAMVGVPVGKQRYTYKDRLLANSSTLAALNLDNGDTLNLQIRDKK
ncbi:hypothetical protein JCM3774_003173 [Rhodotorula dairenensis]